MIVDEELEMICRARGGDSAAYEHLYRHYSATVHSWCLQITCNCADAEDLAQEVFLRLFLKLPTFRGDSKLSTWLYRVVVNCALMQFRKHKRTVPSVSAVLPKQPSSFDGDITLEQTVPASAREVVMIMQAVATLAPGKRSVFIMHDVSGFTHREIAQRLHLSIEGSKCRLRRARMELRSVLA